MAKRKKTKRRRAGKMISQQAAQTIQGVIIGPPKSDSEFAGSTSVPSGFAPDAPSSIGNDLNAAIARQAETLVTYPRFDNGSYCEAEFRDVPVEAEDGRIIYKRIAVPQRNVTVRRSCKSYRIPVQPERFIPETVEALAVPDTWTRSDVLNWVAHGLMVTKALPDSHIYPADARAVSLPIIREATEAYGWAETQAHWTPNTIDVAIMEITLGWTGRLRNERHRKALLMFCAGMTSAAISRALNYRYRGYGKRLAEEAADLLGSILNADWRS